MSTKHFFLFPAVYLSVAFGTLVHATSLFVPAYFHLSNRPTWSDLGAAAQTVPTTVILNPNIGFGASVDPNCVNAIGQILVTGDPGVVPDEVYLSKPVVDNLVVFEGSIRSYVHFQPEEWQHNYPMDRFTHIVYDANSRQMKQLFSETDKNHIGNLYITNDKLPNPYDSLSQYGGMELEMAAVTP